MRWLACIVLACFMGVRGQPERTVHHGNLDEQGKEHLDIGVSVGDMPVVQGWQMVRGRWWPVGVSITTEGHIRMLGWPGSEYQLIVYK